MMKLALTLGCLLLFPQDADSPPTLTYPGTRTSEKWIKTPRGSVAVDKGVEWKGVTVYLSIMSDLVAVDKKTGQCTWSINVGAFWDTVSFKEVKGADGKKAWCVWLTTTEDRKQNQFHDLKTGKKVVPAGSVKDPEGKKFKVDTTWSGSGGNEDGSTYRLLHSAKEWKKIQKDLFDGVEKTPSADLKVDFEKEAILVMYRGRSSNCNGISVSGAWESKKRILIRINHHAYQSDMNPPPEWPYGVFVLPRRDGIPYIVETNRQRYIAGPPIWKEFKRFRLEEK